MGILIKSILELPVMEQARLLAGSSGQQRTVEGFGRKTDIQCPR